MSRFNRCTFIASYPKSGNTWMRLLLLDYFSPPNDRFLDHADTSRHLFNTVSPHPTTDWDLHEQVQLHPAVMYHIQSMARDQEPLVKTHHAYSVIEDIPLFSDLWTKRVLYIMRDPRDICCSLSNHLGKSYDETIDFMVENNSHLTVNMGIKSFTFTWSYHVSSWLQQAMDSEGLDVLTCSYEEMKKDTLVVLKEVLDWLGADEISEKRARMAVESNDFDKLKQEEEIFGFGESSDNAESGFFRKGQVGSWRNELDPEHIKRIETHCGELMEELNYETDYYGSGDNN